MSEQVPELVTQLRYLRQRAKVTQVEIGRQMGLDPSCISNWEHGHAQPSAAKLQTWARILGMELAVVDPMDADLLAQVEYWREETLRLQGVISKAWAILNEEVT